MSQITTFDQRLTRIHARHSRMSEGMCYRIGPDGLMIPVPRRRAVPVPPLRVVAMLAAMTYACKVMLFLALGEGVYVARLDLLLDGGAAGEVAMRVMQPDAVMRTAAEMIARADTVWLNLT